MKISFFKTKLIMLTVISALSITACGQKPKETLTQTDDQSKDSNISNKNAPSNALEEIPLGESTDGIYTNKDFGIQMSYPKDWIVMDEVQKTDSPTPAVTVVESSEANIVIPLFNASSIDGSNISLTIERSSDLAKYIENLTTILSNPQLGMSVSEPKDETISGKLFKHLSVETKDSNVKQNYYVSTLDNYILLLVTSSSSENATNLIDQSIKSLKIKGAVAKLIKLGFAMALIFYKYIKKYV